MRVLNLFIVIVVISLGLASDLGFAMMKADLVESVRMVRIPLNGAKNILLIGGSRGLGEYLARTVPDEQDQLWIVSRTQPPLNVVSLHLLNCPHSVYAGS